METSQLLFFALIFVGFMAFNYVMQRAAKRLQARQQEEALQQQEALQRSTGEPAEYDPFDDVWGRNPSTDPAAHMDVAEPVQSVAPPPEHSPVHARARTLEGQRRGPIRLRRIHPGALFESKEAFRRAIVGMTVLGPCRALDPYDSPRPQTPPSARTESA